MPIHFKKTIHNKPFPASKNQNLLDFTDKLVGTDADFDRLINKVLFDIRTFYLQDKNMLRKLLKKKMIKGGEEHGSPIMPFHERQKEKRNEWIDALGWEAHDQFNLELEKSK